MRRLVNFLSYNNAVPLVVTILAVGAGSTFAASNPESIYSATSTVVSVDNTYIVNKNFSAYSPQAQITGVTEDAENYYVAYNLATIDVVDSVWQDTVKGMQMSVSKAFLGDKIDLGVYATKQIKEVVDYEKSRLVKTQEIEKKNVSQKVVATTYGGLIGKFLDESTEALPGYTPVVDTVPEQIASPADFTPSQTASVASSDTSTPSQTPPSTASSQGSLTLQIMGNNPARIQKGTSYIDLGVFVSDPPTDNIADLKTYVDGKEVQSVQIDTSIVGTYTIEYKAADALGNSASLSRSVEVYDPYAATAVASSTEPVATTSTPEIPTATSSEPETPMSTPENTGTTVADTEPTETATSTE
jgi:hypothetical protein